MPAGLHDKAEALELLSECTLFEVWCPRLFRGSGRAAEGARPRAQGAARGGEGNWKTGGGVCAVLCAVWGAVGGGAGPAGGLGTTRWRRLQAEAPRAA